MIVPDSAMNNMTGYNISMDNNFIDNSQDGDKLHVPMYIGIYITIINIIIFMCGIVCNLVVIAVVVVFKHMRTTFNLYLLNLSVADLCILLVCQPVAMAEYFTREKWFLGTAVCKLIPVLENAVHHASLLTILAIACERMDAICKPLETFTQKSRRSRILVPFIWFTALLLASPFAGIAETTEVVFIDRSVGTICHLPIDKAWKKYFIVAGNVIFFTLLLIIFSMHIKIIRKLRSSADLRGTSTSEEMTRSQGNITLLSFDSSTDSSTEHPRKEFKKYKGSSISVIQEEDTCINNNNNNNNNNDDDEEDDDDEGIGADSCEEESGPLLVSNDNSNDNDDGQINQSDEANPLGSQDSLVDVFGTSTFDEIRRKSYPDENRRKSSLFEIVRNKMTTKWDKNCYSDPITHTMLYRRHGSISNEISGFIKRRLSVMRKLSLTSSAKDHNSRITILIIIVIYLFISYIPMRIFIMWQIFAQVPASEFGVERYLNLIWIFRLLMYLHSAANPFIYSFMTTKFSQSFKRLATWGKRKKGSCIYSLPLSQVSMKCADSAFSIQRMNSFSERRLSAVR